MEQYSHGRKLQTTFLSQGSGLQGARGPFPQELHLSLQWPGPSGGGSGAAEVRGSLSSRPAAPEDKLKPRSVKESEKKQAHPDLESEQSSGEATCPHA